MGLRLQKSFKLGPLKLNLSKSGLGVSTGIKGARIGVNSKGKVYSSVGIPGTGLSSRQTHGALAPANPAPKRPSLLLLPFRLAFKLLVLLLIIATFPVSVPLLLLIYFYKHHQKSKLSRLNMILLVFILTASAGYSQTTPTLSMLIPWLAATPTTTTRQAPPKVTTRTLPIKKSITVYINPASEYKKYHLRDCSVVTEDSKPIDLLEAAKLGYKPCLTCRAPGLSPATLYALLHPNSQPTPAPQRSAPSAPIIYQSGVATRIQSAPRSPSVPIGQCPRGGSHIPGKTDRNGNLHCIKCGQYM